MSITAREVAVNAVLEPAPCDACWHATRCRAEHLACDAFARFLDGDRWQAVNRTPTRAQFEELLE